MLTWIKPPFAIPLPISALLLQVTAVASVALAVWLLSLKLTAMLFAGCCGTVAVLLSLAAKLPKWWLIIQGAFIPAMAATLMLEIPGGYFLAAFLIFWAVYWNTFRTRIPLYLSSEKIWLALDSCLPPPDVDKPFQFIDIGSGLGGVLVHLANARPDGIYVGIESAPLPFLYSWLRIHIGRNQRCQVRWGDFWRCNLADYDVVFAYLSPAPMAQLWLKAQAEMQSGAIFISSTFAIPGQTPDRIIQVDDLHHSTLMVWRM